MTTSRSSKPVRELPPRGIKRVILINDARTYLEQFGLDVLHDLSYGNPQLRVVEPGSPVVEVFWIRRYAGRELDIRLTNVHWDPKTGHITSCGPGMLVF